MTTLPNYAPSLYVDNFDSKFYARTYVTEDVQYPLIKYPEEFLHRMFAQGFLKGKDLLDFGCGPTIRCAISSSAHVPDLYLADLLDQNRKEIEKWVNQDPDAIDYTWQLKYVAKLEGVRDYHLLEDRIRKAIKGILPCNFLLPNPLHPKEAQFDIVTSSFCVDCINDRTEYFQAVKNVASLVRPGGHLALLSVLDSIYYNVGSVDLPASNVDAQTVKSALTDAGLKILVFEEVCQETLKPSMPANFGAISGAIARKV